MAITPRAAGTWAYAASGSVTPTLPTHATGDMLLVWVACKSSTGLQSITTATSGWFRRNNGSDGSVVTGSGIGSVFLAVFEKEAASSSETAPTINFSVATYGVAGYVAQSFEKGAGDTWDTNITDREPFAATTSVNSTISTGLGLAAGTITAGDLLVVTFASRDDSAFTVPTFTVAGVTLGTVVEFPAAAGLTTTGDDGSYDSCYRLATAGTSSAPPVATATIAASESGMIIAVRLRVTAGPSNITVTPTTAALVATKYAPTVTASDKQLVTPSTATLTSAKFAPTVRLGQIITVPTAGGAGYASTVTADSPVAYWRFGEASGSPQDSAGTNHVTVTGGTPTYAQTGALTGDANTAIRLDRASSEYYTAPDAAALDVGDGPFSIEFWAKRASTGIWAQVLDKASPSFSIYFYTDNLLHAESHGVGDWVASTPADTNTSAFHHWVVTKNANSNSHIYRDGVDVTGTTTNRTLVDGAGALYIGSYNTSSAPTAGSYFDGTLDEIAIYKSVLSAATVLAHYTAGTSAGGLRLTTYAPTIRQGVGVIPTTKALTLATFAPTVRTPILATPTTRALTLATFAPTIRLNQIATPTTAALVVTKYAPTARVPVLATPATAAITATKFAPTVTASDKQLVTPTTKALTLSTFAPTVTANAGTTITPTTATLTLTKFAPTVRTPVLATPPTVSLTITRYAPTARTPVLATPTTASLTITKYAPVVRLVVIPATRALTITKYAPAVTTPVRATPGTATLALTKFAPTVTATNRQIATPTTAAIVITRYAPAVSATAHQRVTPTTATLTVTKFAPTVTATAHVAVVPTTKALTLSTFVPLVTASNHQRVVPTTKALTITRYEPDLSQSDAKTAIPTTKALALQTYPPTVTTPNPQLVTVPKASLTITKYAPTARTPITVTPTTKALSTTKFAPTVRLPILVTPTTKALALQAYQPTVSSPLRVTPTTASLTLTKYAPTIVNPQRFTPTTKALTLTTYAPVARIAYRFTPTTAALVLATFAPTISFTTNVLATPANAALILTTYPPFADLSAFKYVEPPTAALVLTTYPPTAEQHSITPLPYPIYGFAIVAIGDTAGVGTAGGGATVTTVEEGSTTVSTSGPSARVTIR